jgi:hypothetical protein
MSLMLHVFPQEKFQGWDGTNDPSTLLLSESFPAEELDEPLDGDGRFVVYTIPGECSIPRINLAALPVLEGMGAEPVATVAVVDVDNADHVPWSSLDEAEAHMVDLLSRATESPEDLLFNAAFYTTRAGYRLIWRLTDPLPIGKYRALLRYIMADLREKYGIDSDPSSDEWNRLFRMPRAVRDGVQLQTFAELDPLAEATLDPYRFGELACNDDFVAEIAGEHPVPMEDLGLDVWKAAFKHPYLKRGRPFPPDDSGSTYRTMRRAIASLAHEGPVVDPEHLFSMVAKTVEASPGRSLQEAWKMCVWTGARQRGLLSKPPEEEQRPLTPDPIDGDEWDEWFRYIDKRYAPTLNNLRAGLAFTPKTQAEAKLLGAVFKMALKLRITEATTLYRMFYPSAQASLVDPMKVWEQCEASAAQAKAEGEGAATDDEKMAAVYTAEQPLTVAIPGTSVLYQLDLREPTHPTYQVTDKSCLIMHYSQMTAPNLPFDADYSDGTKTRSLDQLLLDYGNSASKVRYVTGQRGAAFVPNLDGNALEIGVHALYPELQPVYHADVHEWLRLFGGSDPDKFLDWLAVVTLTDFPACALYVHGKPGSGKSMLLQGLAAMWGGSPVPFANVSADFNESLLASPIIAADEELPPDRGDLSGVFRNLVANSTHDIRIKFQANATLHSCLRMLIVANETDVLDFKKTLSGRSLQAIVERILFIEQGNAPVDFLKALGGRKATALWAERAPGVPGLIGEHLLWLRENRKVQSDGRFLVEGVMTDWHRSFIGQQGIKPDVIKVIALAAKNAAKMWASGQQVTPGVQVRKDKRCVLITKEAVVSQWATHGRSDAPRERALNKTLGQLDEKVSVGLTRPRIGNNNPSAGQSAIVVTFDTLVASQYVTLSTLTGDASDDIED